jgi:DNA-binding transcriptional LysR family regulator
MPEYLIRHTTLRQLQIFEATVRLGSFTRAAEELFLTQPTISMQIKKLAEAVGMPLFEHVGRSVKPTEAGRELYESCRKIFDALANLEMKVSDLQGMRRGRLRVAVITTVKYFLPELLGEFCSRHPGIEVALKVSNRDRIMERLSNDEDDLYIVGAVPSDADVTAYPFAPNPLVVVAPRDHPLVGRKNIKIEELAEYPFIGREPGSGTRDAVRRVFLEKGPLPKVKMELGSNEAIKHAVVAGLGLAVMSLHSMTLDGPDGPLALLDVEGFPIVRQWYIVHPKGKELSLVAQAFLEYALEAEPAKREQMCKCWPGLNLGG